MPFPKAPQKSAIDARIAVSNQRSRFPWRGFGSTVFALAEPELVERPGRSAGVLPSEPVIQELMHMAYQECGLSRARVNPFRYEPDVPGEYKPVSTWTDQDFEARKIDQVMDYLEPARKVGLAEVFVTVAGRELHRSLLSSNARTLHESAYEEYVRRAIALIERWKTRFGVEISAWALFNEPNFPVSEPTILDIDGHVQLTTLLGRELQRRRLDTKILVADDWSIRHCGLKIASAVLSDREARQYVTAVGYHSYDGYDFAEQDWREFSEERRAREELSALCERHNIPLWMTEVSNYRPSSNDWKNVVFRMGQIHDDLVHGQVCAWDFMLAWWQGAWRKNDRGGPQGLAEFYYEPDGSVRRTQLTGTATAIGHWSRIVRPGWNQMAVKSDASDVRASAFIDTANQKLAVIVIQDTGSPVKLSFNIPDPHRWSPVATGYYSNPIERWGDLGPIRQTQGIFSLTLPEHCVATITFASEVGVNTVCTYSF